MALRKLVLATLAVVVCGCWPSNPPPNVSSALPPAPTAVSPPPPPSGGSPTLAPAGAGGSSTDGTAANSAGNGTPPAAANTAPSAPGTPPNAAAGSPAAKPNLGQNPLQAAQRLAQGGQVDEALDVLREALKNDDKNRQLVLVLMQFTQGYAMQKLQAKDEAGLSPLFLESGALARRLAKEFGPLRGQERDLVNTALYNEACVLAKDDKADAAIQSLKEAVEAGFKDLAMLDADADFNSIRDGDAFKKWRGETEAAISELVRQEVGEKLAAQKPFPFDFTLNDPDGQPHKLADLRGKIVVVDVWGTWCPPCRKAIPHLVALHKKYQKEGVEIVGINYEGGSPDEDAVKIKDFVKENGITYACVLGDDVTQKQIPNFEGYPTMLFIDREGKVRLKHVGYSPQSDLEAVLTTLLAEKVE